MMPIFFSPDVWKMLRRRVVLVSMLCAAAALELAVPWPAGATPLLLALAAYQSAAYEERFSMFVGVGLICDYLTGAVPGGRPLLYALFYLAGMRRFGPPGVQIALTVPAAIVLHAMLLSGGVSAILFITWPSVILTWGAAPLVHLLYRRAA